MFWKKNKKYKPAHHHSTIEKRTCDLLHRLLFSSRNHDLGDSEGGSWKGFWAGHHRQRTGRQPNRSAQPGALRSDNWRFVFLFPYLRGRKSQSLPLIVAAERRRHLAWDPGTSFGGRSRAKFGIFTPEIAHRDNPITDFFFCGIHQSPCKENAGQGRVLAFWK